MKKRERRDADEGRTPYDDKSRDWREASLCLQHRLPNTTGTKKKGMKRHSSRTFRESMA